jgi:hypothetical protein
MALLDPDPHDQYGKDKDPDTRKPKKKIIITLIILIPG